MWMIPGIASIKSGESRQFATVSRPDICARLAQVAAEVNVILDLMTELGRKSPGSPRLS